MSVRFVCSEAWLGPGTVNSLTAGLLTNGLSGMVEGADEPTPHRAAGAQCDPGNLVRDTDSRWLPNGNRCGTSPRNAQHTQPSILLLFNLGRCLPTGITCPCPP